jgi:hypothetical protein
VSMQAVKTAESLNWSEVSWLMGPLGDYMIFVFNLKLIDRTSSFNPLPWPPGPYAA